MPDADTHRLFAWQASATAKQSAFVALLMAEIEAIEAAPVGNPYLRHPTRLEIAHDLCRREDAPSRLIANLKRLREEARSYAEIHGYPLPPREPFLPPRRM